MQLPIYLLIGNGRVARHFQYYLTQQGFCVRSWHQGESTATLQQYLTEASHILILISDDAIEDFIKQNLSNVSAVLVHFSGSLVISNAIGAHPLMSFGLDLFDLDKYKAIPFVIDDDAPAFEEVLPGLVNPHWRLNKALKPKYHALCVLSGNFSCLLWQKIHHSFKHDLAIPPEFMFPYLQQITENIYQSPKTALTGPLVRHDNKTIAKNLEALDSDPFQQVYESFVECYKKLEEERFYENF